MKPRVRVGIEVLRADGFKALAGRRVGLLTNPSAVDSDLNSTYDILRRAPQVKLVALFAPEHGIKAAVRDGVSFSDSADPLTGIPIYSLYGDSFRPTREMLSDVDLLVCDIQDIGTRFYTFIWTMSYLLEAAGEYGVEMLILDRPNPLGDTVVGSSVRPEFSSIVGRFPIPIQHGMTIGELARLFNALWNPHPASLAVIPCEGWQRHMRWNDTGLPFVPPSPNMPHFVTAQHYPGACLVEGTTLSEGRGTALPFEIVGAPFIDSRTLAEHLNAQAWVGVRFRPHTFTPTDSKFAGETCEGVQAHITDANTYQPVITWLGVLRELRRLYPGAFDWKPHLDLLTGGDDVRLAIERGDSLAEITAGWDAFCADFRQQRAPYLLYPEG